MEINKNIKNSYDTIRNTQFMSLSPTIIEKLDEVYVDALDFIIENENSWVWSFKKIFGRKS